MIIYLPTLRIAYEPYHRISQAPFPRDYCLLGSNTVGKVAESTSAGNLAFGSLLVRWKAECRNFKVRSVLENMPFSRGSDGFIVKAHHPVHWVRRALR